MTDRELLELAAKAAGVFMTRDQWPYSDQPSDEDFATHFNEDDGSITGRIVWYGGNGEVGGTDDLTWDPLNDDGDALRLAVKLGLVVSIDIQLGGETEAWPYAGMGDCADERHRGDPYAATRRAIVRAAAEIGRAMQ